MSVKMVFGGGMSDEQGTVAEYLGSGIRGWRWRPRNLGAGQQGSRAETSPFREPGAMQPCRSRPHLNNAYPGYLNRLILYSTISRQR